MNYKQFDKWDDYIFGGSAMVGTFHSSFDELTQKFGQPIHVNGERVEYRWLFQCDDGTVFTIFNDKKVRHQDANTWFIGGFGQYDKKTKENLSYRAAKEAIGF